MTRLNPRLRDYACNIHEVRKRENSFTNIPTHGLSSKKVLSRAVLSYLGQDGRLGRRIPIQVTILPR